MEETIKLDNVILPEELSLFNVIPKEENKNQHLISKKCEDHDFL